MPGEAIGNRWRPISTAPEGVAVQTMICNVSGERRNVQNLTRHGRLWFFPDGKMYVYYTPTHWKPLEEKACPKT